MCGSESILAVRSPPSKYPISWYPSWHNGSTLITLLLRVLVAFARRKLGALLMLERLFSPGVLHHDTEWTHALQYSFSNLFTPLKEVFAIIFYFSQPSSLRDIYDRHIDKV